MQSVTLVALSVFFFVQQSSAAGYQRVGKDEYYLGKKLSTWREADAFCKKLWNGRGNLAHFDGPFSKIMPGIYVGASDIAKRGTFVWSDGYPLEKRSPPKIVEWILKQGLKYKEHCVYLNLDSGDYAWQLGDCNRKMAFLCKLHNYRIGPHGVEYYFGSTLLKRNHAYATCWNKFGHRNTLVKINSAEENKWVVEQAGNHDIHIGLSDYRREGNFVWADGHPLRYSNWDKGKPNNSKKNYDDCVYIKKDSGGKWADTDCKSEMRVVCKNYEVFRVAFGKEYLFLTHHRINKNWSEANTICKNQWRGKGSLVRVESAAENQFLYETAGKKSVYIGANDLAKEGTFVWSDGCPLKYSNWDKGEPNDAGNKEDCTQIWNGGGGKWKDTACSQKSRFICQFGVKCYGHIRIRRLYNPFKRFRG